MSCNADIETETIENVLSVPIQSVTTRSEGPKMDEASKGDGDENQFVQIKGKEKEAVKPKEVVFIVSDNNAKMVEVETGLSDDNYIYIKKGLEGGEEVVSGSYSAISRELKDGVKVRVEEKRSASKQK
jgi:HlyD family secretion protein